MLQLRIFVVTSLLRKEALMAETMENIVMAGNSGRMGRSRPIEKLSQMEKNHRTV